MVLVHMDPGEEEVAEAMSTKMAAEVMGCNLILGNRMWSATNRLICDQRRRVRLLTELQKIGSLRELMKLGMIGRGNKWRNCYRRSEVILVRTFCCQALLSRILDSESKTLTDHSDLLDEIHGS